MQMCEGNQSNGWGSVCVLGGGGGGGEGRWGDRNKGFVLTP